MQKSQRTPEGTGRASAGGGLSAVGVHFSNKNRAAQRISPQRPGEFTHPCWLTWIPIKLYFSDSASLSPWLCIDSFCLKFSTEVTSPEKYPLEYCLACFLFPIYLRAQVVKIWALSILLAPEFGWEAHKNTLCPTWQKDSAEAKCLKVSL